MSFSFASGLPQIVRSSRPSVRGYRFSVCCRLERGSVPDVTLYGRSATECALRRYDAMQCDVT